MRRLLVILVMILLLPLRGWAGDVMGVQMAARGALAQVADDMPPGCPMHAQAGQVQAGDDADGTQVHGDMKNCASCGLCIPLLALDVARLDAVTFARHLKPSMGFAGFVSASVAPTVKPPIF